MMHARELKGGEARSKEHVVSVEVSGREEHSALGSASHPGRAVPLAGPAGRKSALHGSREQRTGRGQAEALPWPRRKRQAGRAAERAARVVAGGGEQGQHGGGFLWAEEFSARQAQGEQLARERHREE